MNKDVLESLTLEEKARLVCGYSTMGTYPIERLGIPALAFSDGPNGLRKEAPGGDSLSGLSSSLPSTCFPTGTNLASSFDKELIFEVGKAIANECRHYGVNVLLGPAINIKRNPLCGRNFEYYSEDPLLAGYIGVSMVNGLQSLNVGATPKHFACNNLENYRYNGDSIVDERALREIYLKGFEILTRKSHPWAYMNAYNKINGEHASENYHVMREILRDEWGFDGLLMTDWGGLKDRALALKASTDLEMPGMIEHNVQLVIDAVNNGELDISILNESVLNILRCIDRTKVELQVADFKGHYDLAVKLGTESAVLLKNDNRALPLSKEDKILILGGLFEEPRYQGSGSSLLNPFFLSYHKDALGSINYCYERGYKASELTIDKELEDKAIKEAANYDQVVVYLGQNDYVESEGSDRDTMCLPENQLSLINRLIELKKKIIVVLFGGSSIELPFINDVEAILYMGLPGEGIGEATKELLFGEVSPSGRLNETWRKTYSDTLFGDRFAKSPIEVYKESIYVGYRYYLSANKDVLFPFGYGLSYVDFRYENPSILDKGDSIEVSFDLTNLGDVVAKEVSQVYVSLPDSNIHRPLRELKGFTKTELGPNETKRIAISIDKKDLEVYLGKWRLEKGTYQFMVSKDANTPMLQLSLELDGEVLDKKESPYDDLSSLDQLTDEEFEKYLGYKIPTYEFGKKPYTLETPIGEYQTPFGKIFKKVTIGLGEKQYKKGLKMKDGPEKEREKKTGWFIAKSMPCNSLRSLCFSSSGILPYPIAKGLEQMINGHYMKGIKWMLKKK